MRSALGISSGAGASASLCAGAGLGEALLYELFGAFWRGGKRVIGLGVDATSDTGADRLYRRVGMHVHWGAVVFEKALA